MMLVSSVMTDPQDILKFELQAMGRNVQLHIVWVLLVEGRGGKEWFLFAHAPEPKFSVYGGRGPPYYQKFLHRRIERENPP